MEPKELGMSHGDYVASTYRKLFNIPFRNRAAAREGYGFPISKLEPEDTYMRRWIFALITEEDLLEVKQKFDLEMQSVRGKDNNEVLRGLKFEGLWLRQEGYACALAKKHAEEAKAEREYRECEQRVKERDAKVAAARISRTTRHIEESDEEPLDDGQVHEEPQQPSPLARKSRAANASWRKPAAMGGRSAVKRSAVEAAAEVKEEAHSSDEYDEDNYKGAEDRAKLAGLSEFERETLLTERHERKMRRLDSLQGRERMKML